MWEKKSLKVSASAVRIASAGPSIFSQPLALVCMPLLSPFKPKAFIPASRPCAAIPSVAAVNKSSWESFASLSVWIYLSSCSFFSSYPGSQELRLFNSCWASLIIFWCLITSSIEASWVFKVSSAVLRTSWLACASASNWAFSISWANLSKLSAVPLASAWIAAKWIAAAWVSDPAFRIASAIASASCANPCLPSPVSLKELYFSLKLFTDSCRDWTCSSLDWASLKASWACCLASSAWAWINPIAVAIPIIAAIPTGDASNFKAALKAVVAIVAASEEATNNHCWTVNWPAATELAPKAIVSIDWAIANLVLVKTFAASCKFNTPNFLLKVSIAGLIIRIEEVKDIKVCKNFCPSDNLLFFQILPKFWKDCHAKVNCWTAFMVSIIFFISNVLLADPRKASPTCLVPSKAPWAPICLKLLRSKSKEICCNFWALMSFILSNSSYNFAILLVNTLISSDASSLCSNVSMIFLNSSSYFA